jgi:DNA-binding SARP family transcriptional activator
MKVMQVEQDIPPSCRLRVCLHGPLEVWKRTADGAWKLVEKEGWGKGRPARSVFKRLLAAPGRRLSRGAIQDDLWPDTENFELADKTVYNAINQIRRVTGKTLVRTFETIYEVADQSSIWVDCDACEALLKEAENWGYTSKEALPLLEQALAYLERGELLEGESGTWVYGLRKKSEDMLRQCRLWLAQAYEDQGKLWQAGEQYRALLQPMPPDEDALRAWIEMLHRHGKTQDALRCYQDMKGFVEAQGFPLLSLTHQLATQIEEQSKDESPSYSPLVQGVSQLIQGITIPKPVLLENPIHELRNVLKKSNSGEISRRQLVLFGTGAILTLSNPFVLVPEEILPFCTQNIATCWQMSNGGRDNLAYTRWMISSYLPTLTTLATQSSPHQKLAASQAAACYCLRSLLDYHIENLAVAEEDAKQLIYYSKLTEDPEWIVRAHVHFALVSYYRDRPEQALVACREANRYKNQAPPAALFDLYKQQATYEAQVGLKDEATASLHLAYDNLLRTTHGQSRAYVDTNLYEWALWKGITHYHLGEYKESKDILESVDPLNPDSLLPERVRTGILNNLIFAELRAKERDIERCIMVWKEAVEWAKKLQSELRLAEVRRAYDWLLLVFPHEPRVTALKELIP